MSTKFELLKFFFMSMDQERAKVETGSHGFDYLLYLKSLGKLEYSEWKNGVFKYKLTELKPHIFDDLLEQHLATKINLCIYFNGECNNIFCFNLDSFNDDDNSLKLVAQLMLENLKKLRIQPLILKSGHGYHFWCRLSDMVENSKIQSFMQAVVDITVFQATVNNINIAKLQCICYPRHKSHDISIRLFGSIHTVTGRFIHVVEKIDSEDVLLDKEKSWEYFEHYSSHNIINKTFFEQAAVPFAERLKSVID